MKITIEQLEDYLMTLGFEPRSFSSDSGVSRLTLHWKRVTKATVRFAFIFWESDYFTFQQGTDITP